ncbi:site-specific integrase [Hymenobacter sp. 5317J-9]|uniref:site-specific integrase n=1 Tax=Hymenobacter sp. 5317J-9 TaxID=2932250 RepID=UPI001FD709F2|nr:site-specific integrase [Hymenobacter sp. 5317J-9]UOQ96656.1 site-specific integrase [Hymenobacter sp. 5317J-9]
MKITRQLRLDALAADGTAPIQLTITWEGNRLRVGTGSVVKPEHWDEKQHQVKVQKGTPHETINPRLNRASEAASDAQAGATRQGRRLPKDELKAAVEAALRLEPVVAPPPPGPEGTASDAVSDFERLQRQWLAETLHRPRSGSGKPMAQTTQAGFEATLQRLLQYAGSRGIALDVERLDLAFYQDFRTYVLDELGQGLNTFGKHITRLKTFLAWVELELDVPVHRHYRKFVAPRKRGRVDALTEPELHLLAGLNFQDAETRERLLALRGLDHAQSNRREDWSAERWIAHVELARDKFLECCYTGLRISDANRAAWQHVRGNLLVLDGTAKNEATVYIPFYDDELFKPVALAARYEHRSPQDLLVPDCYRANEFLRVVQRLAGITRLKLTTKIGRKTFVTLKLYQGVPARLIMQATGHQTEEAFNHYVGVDELRLVEEFMRKSTRRRAA